MSLKRRYNVGDTCWIDIGRQNDTGQSVTTRGVVAHSFKLEHHPNKEFYVIEPAFHSDFDMKIRDVYLMSDTEGKALPVASL